MEKDLKKGQWLFTCSMKPKQFGKYVPRNRADYGESKNEEEFLEWCKYDDFETLEGSSHSQGNCGCKPITEKYVRWFIDNGIDFLYDSNEPDEVKWDKYVERVKKRCEEDNIEFEGI